MPDLNPLKNAILAIAPELPHDGELYFRPMFGGMFAFFNGRPFAILLHEKISLKLAVDDREQLLQIGGRMLEFREDMAVSKTYVVVPEELWRNPDEFCGWARRSVDYILELPPPKARKKK